MDKIYFNKDDLVPNYLMKSTDKDGNNIDLKITFGCDVEISKDRNGCIVRPTHRLMEGECMVQVHNETIDGVIISPEDNVCINGAPTIFNMN